MNAFASPEEAFPYQFEEFPKPEDQVSVYSQMEGAVEFQLRDLVTGESYSGSDSAPVVQPVLFQDFKQVLSANQA